MEINIFDKNNVGVLSPYSGVETIDLILQNIGYGSNFSSLEARKDGLKIIHQLFELDLIEVSYWGKYKQELKIKGLSIIEKMMYIQELWFKGADFVDFHNMPMFKYKDWYIAKIEQLGMTHTTDWGWFVEKKIGNLEKWIENNRPG